MSVKKNVTGDLNSHRLTKGLWLWWWANWGRRRQFDGCSQTADRQWTLEILKCLDGGGVTYEESLLNDAAYNFEHLRQIGLKRTIARYHRRPVGGFLYSEYWVARSDKDWPKQWPKGLQSHSPPKEFGWREFCREGLRLDR